MAYKDDATKFTHVPRKVFDKYVDRMALKRSRDRSDNRNDLQILMNLIKHLQEDLLELQDHVNSHCTVLNGEPDHPKAPGPPSTEGL